MSKVQSLHESSLTDKLLQKSAKGVTFLLFGQVFTKLATFMLNQILIAYISPKSLGINAFLEFLMNTSLFFSREGIRLSAQRIHDTEDDIDEKKDIADKYDHSKLFEGSKVAIWQSVINFAYIPLLIGTPLSTGLFIWQYPQISDVFKHMHLFNASMACVWLAVIAELLSEPFYVLNQFNLNYDKRTSYETLAVTLSCFSNFAIVFYFRNDEIEGIPVFAFAVSKLVHSLVLLIAYFWDFRRFKRFSATTSRLHIRPTKIYKSETHHYYFDSDAKNHFYSSFFSIAFKHLLTEGDKIVINWLCTHEEQGIYSLISNYGSLVARLVFAPIEESLRTFLTRLLLSAKSHSNIQMSVDILRKITSFYIYLSLIIAIFGPLNSGYLIQMLVGNNWSNVVSETIPLYTLYLPLLAFNGILESVHQSTASGKEVMTYTWFMVFFSVIFVATSYIGIEQLKLTLQGLILSNMINMAMRIFYCYGFIEKFYRKNNVKFDIVAWDNSMKSIIMVALGIYAVDLLLFGVTRNFAELLGNCVLALVLVAFIMFKEKNLILSFIRRKPLA